MSNNNGDDFEDDLDPAETETFDDEPAGDEDWDEYEDQPEDENLDDEDDSSEPVAKKKSGAFNKILIAVGVLVVVGVIAMQFGKGGAPTPPPMPVTEAAATTEAPEAAPAGMLDSAAELTKMAEIAKQNAQQQAAQQNTAATPTPVPGVPEAAAPTPTPAPAVPEAAPAVTPKEVANVPTPPMPAPMGSPEKVAEISQAAPEVLDATPAPSPAPAAKPEDSATRMPSAQDMMLKTSTTPVAPDVTPAPAPTPSGNADTAALNMKMDTILSRLTSIEGEVSALKQKPDVSADIAELKSAIATLEEKKASAPSAKTQSSDSPARAKKAVAAEEPAPVLPEEKPAPQILGAPDSGPEINPVAEPVAKKSSAKPVKVSTSWVLKGAQPDQATVAKAGESDSRTVRVGDTLPGIGRITAVEYKDGRWAVIGTQGRINQ